MIPPHPVSSEIYDKPCIVLKGAGSNLSLSHTECSKYRDYQKLSSLSLVGRLYINRTRLSAAFFNDNATTTLYDHFLSLYTTGEKCRWTVFYTHRYITDYITKNCKNKAFIFHFQEFEWGDLITQNQDASCSVNTVTNGFFKSLIHKHFRDRQFSSTRKVYYS